MISGARMLVVLCAFALVGGVCQWLVLGKGRLRQASWGCQALTSVLLGVAFAYLLSMRSLWALALFGLLLLTLRLFSPAEATAAASTSSRRAGFGAALGALAAWVFARPFSPLVWDEFVWLTKARIEGARGWGALTAAALVPGEEVFPSGYPLLWSLLPAWLAGGDDIGLLILAFGLAKLLCLAVFAWALVQQGLTRAMLCAAALALLAPLPLEHLRLLYADAPVGFLAAALTLVFVQVSRSERVAASTPGPPGALALAIAVVLTGFKDEGMGHVAAIAGAAAIFGTRRTRWYAGLALLGALVTTVTWRLTLREHGIANSDHAFGWPALHAWPAVAGAAAAHASDVLSWGLLWPITFCTAAALLALPLPTQDETVHTNAREARLAASAWVGQAAMLQLALLLGPERVRIFALDGTLLNRMLVQVTPAAAVVLIVAAARWQNLFMGAVARVHLTSTASIQTLPVHAPDTRK